MQTRYLIATVIIVGFLATVGTKVLFTYWEHQDRLMFIQVCEAQGGVWIADDCRALRRHK